VDEGHHLERAAHQGASLATCRGYNVDNVLTWLEAAPATTVWLADQLGRTLPGVQPLDQWWQDAWLPSTRISLDAGILLAGRDEAAAAIRTRLATGPQVVTVGGDLRPTEAVAVVAASLDADATTNGEALRVRTLLVTDASSLPVLLRQAQPLVLVLMDPALAAHLPLKHPHRVVLVGTAGGHADVVVPPVDAAVAEAHLRTSGETWETAARLAALARRSVSALRRVLAQHPATLTPAWARHPELTSRRLLLAGAWNGAVEEDRQALEALVGKHYADVTEAALSLAASPDAPLLGHVDEVWHLQAPSDAWALMSASLTLDDLTAFVALAMDVLSQRDPLVRAAGTDRLARQLAGHRRRYSDSLREGVASTLALLGATEGDTPRPGGRDCSDWAATVLVALWRDANADQSYEFWSSLHGVLSVLAEAAPDSFLRAMRDGLTGTEPVHARMFNDHDDEPVGFGPTPVHSSFLWALEVLAWSADHFDGAVDVLAMLAAIDPGGSWSNRPSRSLTEIFSCWNPNTTADEAQRLAALQRILRDHPDVGRALLLSLIPGQNGFQTAHRAPRYRDWKVEPTVTRPDLVRMTTAVIDLLLSDLGDNPERLIAVIGRLDDMSTAHRQSVAEQLVRLGTSLQDEDTRLRLWTALHDTIVKHREYQDAGWALPENELAPLDAAADALRSVDPVLRELWLFASDWVTLGDFQRRDDLEGYDAELQRRREAALTRLLQARSLDGVRELASRVDLGHLVGTALAAITPNVDADMVGWLADGSPSERTVAFAYLAKRLRDPDPAVLDHLLHLDQRVDVRADLLRATFDPPRAWVKLDELDDDVSARYWRTFAYTGLGHDFPELLAAAEGLLGAGRYAATIHMVSLYARRLDDATSEMAAEVVARACEGLLAGGFDDSEKGLSM